jgi:hypothetical protein
MTDAASDFLDRWAKDSGYAPGRRPNVVDDWFTAHPSRLEQVREARQRGWAWSAITRFLHDVDSFPFTDNPLINYAHQAGIQ